MIPPRPCAAHGVGVGRRQGAPAGAEAAPCGRNTPLHGAAANGSADAMCALLIAGASVGIKCKSGYGSRFWAGACEPKGHAPADAACSHTAEDVAKMNGKRKAAAYADAVQRVRQPCTARRKGVRTCVGVVRCAL